MAWGTIMLRNSVVLGFIRFGCWRGIMGNCYENNLATEDTEDTEKKNLCNLRNLWFLFFIRLRAWPRPHEGLPCLSDEFLRGNVEKKIALYFF
jgi:hypothetical protein